MSQSVPRDVRVKRTSQLRNHSTASNQDISLPPLGSRCCTSLTQKGQAPTQHGTGTQSSRKMAPIFDSGIAAKPVTHVIFDMDGLLIDSEHFYAVAMDNVAQRYGKRFTWETKVKIMGTTAKIYSKIVVDDLSLPITPEEFMKQLDVEYPKVFPLVSLMPGVQKLLDHLKKHNVPMAIASSSKRVNYEQKTNHFGPEFQKYFHHVLLASDEPEVKQSKPAPDTFLVCQKRFNPVPDGSECLVFEDSVAGAIAGCRAGMPVVWVPDTRLDIQSLLRAEPELKPTQVLESVEDFKPEDFGLPPYSD